MNFLAHIYLSGDNDDIKFGNFIGDWVKGNKWNRYTKDIRKGILLHREIDSYTDKHSVVRKSVHRLQPAYGKYAGVAVDILYDHFLAKNWKNYCEEDLKSYVIDFHYLVLERLGKIPKKGRRFAFPFMRKKRLICYANLSCFEEVLEKMAIYTSMPDKVNEAMAIVSREYNLFFEDFKEFFPDLQAFSKTFLDKD